MLDDKLINDLVDAGREAVEEAIPDHFSLPNGIKISTGPLVAQLLGLAAIGVDAVIDKLKPERVDVIADDDVEVVIEITD